MSDDEVKPREWRAFFAWQAERNVLPTLNNLLENREMGLDDGRLLLAASHGEDLCIGSTNSNRSK